MGREIPEGLIEAVKANCLVSDARHWGYYSTCGLLMRLRELYRSEMGVMPYGPVDTPAVLAWIEKREALWQEHEDDEFRDIPLDGRSFDPFDTAGINSVLNPMGLVYGAGGAAYGKALLFLADLDDAYEMPPFRVQVAGIEHARELALNPAMSRDGVIIARKQMALAFVSGKFEDFRAQRSASGPLADAFRAYGMDGSSPPERLLGIYEKELLAYIHHEYAEAHESMGTLGPQWGEMQGTLPHGRASALVRGIKDVLADTASCGMLAHIIATHNAGSLGLYVASLDGFRHTLSAGMRRAYALFRVRDDWDVIEAARAGCYAETRELAERALGLYRDHKNHRNLARAIEALPACRAAGSTRKGV